MPTTTRRVNRDRPKQTLTVVLQELSGQLKTWYALKRQAAELATRVNDEKKDIKLIVEKWGTPNESGSLFLELPSPVSGIAAIKNQKSVSDQFNETTAEEIGRKKKLYDEWVEMVPVFNPDAVRAAYFDRKITKAELDRIFTKKETFSLVLLDKDGKQVS
jgi:hypothetical protein